MQKLRGRNTQQQQQSSLLINSLPSCHDNDDDNGGSSKKRGGRGSGGGSSSSRSSASFLRRARLRWSLLSPWSRTVLMFVLPLLTIHLLLATIDLFFGGYGCPPPFSNAAAAAVGAMDDETAFAVVINTYKRPERLRQAVRHYADTCGKPAGVAQVFVIWCEDDTDPPDPESFFFESGGSVRSAASHQQQKDSSDRRAPVQVIKAPNSLNSRFVPLPANADLMTSKSTTNTSKNKAVFMVDDDVRVDCASLHQGFRAWKVHPWSTVGYYPRLASPPRSGSSSSSGAAVGGAGGEYIEHCWPIVFLRQQVNFILTTKACFLHERYLTLYSSDLHHPKEIRDYVDEHMNCEDVAMSLLVANQTRSGDGDSNGDSNNNKPAMPVFVEGHVSDTGLFGGISTGSGFVGRRAACLADLTAMYRKRGWVSPLNYTYSLREVSWVRHSPGFWWQFRPSNPFEWFALLDLFK